MTHGHDTDLAQKTEDGKVIAARRAGLLACSLSTFLTAFFISSLNVALPALQREFRIDAVLLSWVAMAGILTSAMLVVPFGRLADIYGRRRLFLYGIATFTVSCLLCGFAVSMVALIVFMVIQSIGVALIFSTGMAIVTAIYPPDQRGKALGIATAAVYFGLSSGPFFGGFLTGYLGWRSVFFVIVPVGVFVFLAVRLKLKQEWRDARGETFDLVGSLVYSASLFLVIYGFSLLPGARGFVLLGVGIAAAILFFHWEGRVTAPILHLSLLKGNRRLCLLEPRRTHPLQCDLCRHISDEPLPAVCSSPDAPTCRLHPYLPADSHGNPYSLCREAVGPR